mmetsp:Transcript_12188/g.23032  ORF Transcript_12188/g.23032 Transcript_12188/m.23032 type:complete len:376 (-) Transcript_12188:79-1206(-)
MERIRFDVGSTIAARGNRSCTEQRRPSPDTMWQTPPKVHSQVEAACVTPPKGQWQSRQRHTLMQDRPTTRQPPKDPIRSLPESVLPARERKALTRGPSHVEERLSGIRILSARAEASAWCWEELPEQVRNSFRFLGGLSALPESIADRPYLPPVALDAKPTLVLDLDETLVHFCRGSTSLAAPAVPDVLVEFDDLGVGRVHFRPFAQIFLEVISRSFEVVIFTASQQCYADQVIDALDPTGAFVSHRLYRQHCTEFHGAYFKELALLGRSAAKCLLIDNSPIAVACNVTNSVLIRSWYGDIRDQELLALLDVVEDMRRDQSRGGRFDRYLSHPGYSHNNLQVSMAVVFESMDKAQTPDGTSLWRRQQTMKAMAEA